jgi:hypothetical protein
MPLCNTIGLEDLKISKNNSDIVFTFFFVSYTKENSLFVMAFGKHHDIYSS